MRPFGLDIWFDAYHSDIHCKDLLRSSELLLRTTKDEVVMELPVGSFPVRTTVIAEKFPNRGARFGSVLLPLFSLVVPAVELVFGKTGQVLNTKVVVVVPVCKSPLAFSAKVR